ncbi:MAG: type VI secretion system PAAR protein [Halomonas sp.]|nr:type VI secretion system PAAR protein [Halomonas sp.]MCC5881490.1 type VI secretion system PAAR protein [Halomonas sp.]
MSKKLVLVGDIGTGHDGFPPTLVTAGSPTVLIDGKSVARLGDPLAPHEKSDHPTHPRFISECSDTILLDGKPAALTGHAVSCGGVVIGSASAVGDDLSAGATSSTPVGPALSTNVVSISTERPDPQTEALTMSEAGKQWLKDVEQLRLMPYDDQTGRDITSWVKGATIGYGHLVSEAEWDLYREGIDREQAERLFEEDLAPFVRAVNRSVEIPLAQHQFDAAVMLAYNIGIGAFSSSSAVKLMNDPWAVTPYPTLEEAWKAWNRSQGVVNRGLVNRRAAEWKMYSQGIYERW